MCNWRNRAKCQQVPIWKNSQSQVTMRVLRRYYRPSHNLKGACKAMFPCDWCPQSQRSSEFAAWEVATVSRNTAACMNENNARRLLRGFTHLWGNIISSFFSISGFTEVTFRTQYVPYPCINLLKPTGYVMHQQFNVQQLYVLPTLYLCVLYLSKNKQRLAPLTA